MCRPPDAAAQTCLLPTIFAGTQIHNAVVAFSRCPALASWAVSLQAASARIGQQLRFMLNSAFVLPAAADGSELLAQLAELDGLEPSGRSLVSVRVTEHSRPRQVIATVLVDPRELLAPGEAAARQGTAWTQTTRATNARICNPLCLRAPLITVPA